MGTARENQTHKPHHANNLWLTYCTAVGGPGQTKGQVLLLFKTIFKTLVLNGTQQDLSPCLCVMYSKCRPDCLGGTTRQKFAGARSSTTQVHKRKEPCPQKEHPISAKNVQKSTVLQLTKMLKLMIQKLKKYCSYCSEKCNIGFSKRHVLHSQ